MGKKRTSILRRVEGQGNRKVQRAAVTAEASSTATRLKPRTTAGARQHCASLIDRQAEAAVKRLLAADQGVGKGASIKSLTLAPHIQNKKATFAVTCGVLKYLPILTQLAGPLLEANGHLAPEAAYVLLYECFFGKGVKPNGGAERAILARKGEIAAALEGLKEAAGVESAEELLNSEPAAGVEHTRSARVNLIKSTVDEVLAWLRSKPTWNGVDLAQKANRDPLLPDVLHFPPRTDLHDHPLVLNGRLILQSKASCMPAHALNPEPGWTVLDACAAPGNKTTHVAALLGPHGRVLAFDKEPRRLQRLQAAVAAAGAGGLVTACCADFLALDLQAPGFASVRGVILDPSCSGSGTARSRLEHLLPSHAALTHDSSKHNAPSEEVKSELADGADHGGPGADPAGAAPAVGPGQGNAQSRMQARLKALARFQEAALRHALALPGLQRLVYSTCSVHAAENEAVIDAVLPDAAGLGFRLGKALPAWPRRGLPLVAGWEHLVRVDPEADSTDGFFLALFERVAESVK